MMLGYLVVTAMITGLASELPTAMAQGLTAHGVPAVSAQAIAQLPPVAVLFAAFLGSNRAAPRPGPEAGARHTVASDDRLIEEIRAGRVPLDDPDPVAALLARWRLCSGPNS
jgi:hypothetical protein